MGVVPIMNVRTDFCNSKFEQFDTVKRLIKKANLLESVIGDVVLFSNGRLQKGFNHDLITRSGEFDISVDDGYRFYWKSNGENYYNIDKDGRVLLASRRLDLTTGDESFSSNFESYTSFFKVNALYKNNHVKNSVADKVNFMKSFLDKVEEKDFEDYIYNDETALLSLLEGHYRDNIDYYSYMS